jgi:hypothetical protein
MQAAGMNFFGHGRNLSVSKDLTDHSKQPSSHLPEKDQLDTRLVAGSDQYVKGEYFLNVEVSA